MTLTLEVGQGTKRSRPFALSYRRASAAVDHAVVMRLRGPLADDGFVLDIEAPLAGRLQFPGKGWAADPDSVAKSALRWRPLALARARYVIARPRATARTLRTSLGEWLPGDGRRAERRPVSAPRPRVARSARSRREAFTPTRQHPMPSLLFDAPYLPSTSCQRLDSTTIGGSTAVESLALATHAEETSSVCASPSARSSQSANRQRAMSFPPTGSRTVAEWHWRPSGIAASRGRPRTQAVAGARLCRRRRPLPDEATSGPAGARALAQLSLRGEASTRASSTLQPLRCWRERCVAGPCAALGGWPAHSATGVAGAGANYPYRRTARRRPTEAAGPAVFISACGASDLRYDQPTSIPRFSCRLVTVLSSVRSCLWTSPLRSRWPSAFTRACDAAGRWEPRSWKRGGACPRSTGTAFGLIYTCYGDSRLRLEDGLVGAA